MLKLKDFKGTISHGTMRSEDLIPVFAETLNNLLIAYHNEKGADMASVVQTQRFAIDFLDNIKYRMTSPMYYHNHEQVDQDLDILFDSLDYFAPEGYHFSAHEGDGSDFGFWENE